VAEKPCQEPQSQKGKAQRGTRDCSSRIGHSPSDISTRGAYPVQCFHAHMPSSADAGGGLSTQLLSSRAVRCENVRCSRAVRSGDSSLLSTPWQLFLVPAGPLDDRFRGSKADLANPKFLLVRRAGGVP
jgi:hypothetical protein